MGHRRPNRPQGVNTCNSKYLLGILQLTYKMRVVKETHFKLNCNDIQILGLNEISNGSSEERENCFIHLNRFSISKTKLKLGFDNQAKVNTNLYSNEFIAYIQTIFEC